MKRAQVSYEVSIYCKAMFELAAAAMALAVAKGVAMGLLHANAMMTSTCISTASPSILRWCTLLKALLRGWVVFIDCSRVW